MNARFFVLCLSLSVAGCQCEDNPVVNMDQSVPEDDLAGADLVVVIPDLAGDGGCPAGVCGAIGCACTVGTDCCSGRCDNSVCVPPMCMPQGTACANDGDCCTLFCSSNRCAVRMPPCTGMGSACAKADDCCSGNCATPAGTACAPGAVGCVCGAGTGCKGAGEMCTADNDCCNGLCDNPAGGAGTCALLGGCRSAGEPCGTEGYNGSCCSTVCLDNGGGVPRCQFLGGCRVQDELCKTDGECCSGACEMDGTTLDGTPILRCANASSCLPAGEVCGGQGASSNCCPNGGGDTGCEPTGAGFRRCFGGENSTCVLPGQACMSADQCCNDPYPNLVCKVRTGTTMPTVCCLEDGQQCAFADVCCSGVCTPAMDGVLRCGTTCVANGNNCTVDGDCCAGNCCRPNAAAGGALQCTTDCGGMACTDKQLGDLCSADSECCNSPPVICTGAIEFRTCQLP